MTRVILILLLSLNLAGCGALGTALSFMKGGSKTGGTHVDATANIGDNKKINKIGDEINADNNQGIISDTLTAIEAEQAQIAGQNLTSTAIDRAENVTQTIANTNAAPWYVSFQSNLMLLSIIVSFLLFIGVIIAKMMPSGRQEKTNRDLQRKRDDDKLMRRVTDEKQREREDAQTKLFEKILEIAKEGDFKKG